MKRMAALLALLLLGSAQDGTNPVDRILSARWKELSITPNRLSNDSEFLRRATIDLAGDLPEPEEVIAFLNSTDARKREKKIDELLAREDWPEFWGQRLALAFVGLGQRRRSQLIEPLAKYLESQLEKGTPYDRLVSDMLTASGSNLENPATAFVVAFGYKDRTHRDLAVQVSKLFMGIQLQCAQCHDHPFERYTKDDFFSVVANFAGTQVKQIDKEKKEIEVVDRPRKGGYRPEGYKVDIAPKFIDGSPMSGKNLRDVFVKKLVNPDNKQFARATVNRFWSMLTGQGFVEPVDDFSVRNTPTLPDLLEELASGFVEHRYDLKWLMKTIATSRAYQLSSQRGSETFKDEAKKFYAYGLVRPMGPEQLYGVLLRAEGLTEGQGAGKRNSRRTFFQTFADGGADSPSEYNANIQQIMRMLNVDSPMYAGAKIRGGGRLSAILKKTRKAEEVFEQLYLATLSRRPTREEIGHCLKYYQEHGSGPQAFEDIFFVLLNTNEFFFNH